MVKLTVSIVNFNSGDYLLRALQCLERSKGVKAEVFVIDNNSSDGSAEQARKKFPKVHFIFNSDNKGFGRAHNQILKKATSEYCLVLNPDVEFKDDVIEKAITYLDDHQEVGAVTPEIMLDEKTVDLTAHRGLPTPWASFKYYFLKDDSLYHLSGRDFSKPHEVDAISGAFLLARTEVLKRVGFFDEDYWMYAEDLDLCFRIKELGKRIVYIPGIKVLHYKGVSSGLKRHSQYRSTATLETKKRSLDAFYSTMKIFYKKHLAQNYPFFINWLVYFGINLKWWLARKKLTV